MASFRKVKNGWEAQIARKGVRKSRTFPNKAKAQLWAAETELALFEVQSTGKSPVAGLTVAALIRRYEDEVGGRWSLSKTRSAGRAVSALGDHRVSDLTQASVMRWVTGGSPYAASTSEHMLKTLMGAMSHAKTVWQRMCHSRPYRTPWRRCGATRPNCGT